MKWHWNGLFVPISTTLKNWAIHPWKCRENVSKRSQITGLNGRWRIINSIAQDLENCLDEPSLGCMHQRTKETGNVQIIGMYNMGRTDQGRIITAPKKYALKTDLKSISQVPVTHKEDPEIFLTYQRCKNWTKALTNERLKSPPSVSSRETSETTKYFKISCPRYTELRALQNLRAKFRTDLATSVIFFL